jgi:hypothetical protein
MPIKSVGKVKWNRVRMEGAISKALTKKGGINTRVERQIRNKAEVKLGKAIKEFTRNVRDHPVSKEIDGGPEEENLSGTLGGYGNLFSYIGFDDGSDPVGEVLDLILQHRLAAAASSRIIPAPTVGARGFWKIRSATLEFSWRVVGMDKSKLFTATRSAVPWMGKSWLKGIESGISGLGAYLYVEDGNFRNSRSGTAVQTQTRLRSGGYRPVSYISALYNEFSRNLKGKGGKGKF